MKDATCAFILILLSAAAAFAQSARVFHSGTELLPDCKSYVRFMFDNDKTVSLYDAGECAGYIAASFDEEELMRTMGVVGHTGKPIVQTCVPDDVSLGQLVKIWVKYAEDHPESLNMSGAVILHNALNKVYHCAPSK